MYLRESLRDGGSGSVRVNKLEFSLKAIAGYDSRTFNIGFLPQFLGDRFEAIKVGYKPSGYIWDLML